MWWHEAAHRRGLVVDFSVEPFEPDPGIEGQSPDLPGVLQVDADVTIQVGT